MAGLGGTPAFQRRPGTAKVRPQRWSDFPTRTTHTTQGPTARAVGAALAGTVSRSWGSGPHARHELSTLLDKPISPSRQRMIDDMTARRFKEKVQKDYVQHVRTFAAFLGRSPETATSEHLRRFQLHMARQQISPGSNNAAIAALRFFFTVTLERPDLVRPLTIVNKRRKAPVVLSEEEVARLLEAAPGLKYKAALCVAYGAGLRVRGRERPADAVAHHSDPAAMVRRRPVACGLGGVRRLHHRRRDDRRPRTPTASLIADASSCWRPHMGCFQSSSFISALCVLLLRLDPKREPVFAMQP